MKCVLCGYIIFPDEIIYVGSDPIHTICLKRVENTEKYMYKSRVRAKEFYIRLKADPIRYKKYLEKMIIRHKQYVMDPEHRTRILKNNKKYERERYKTDPEYRIMILKNNKKYYEKNRIKIQKNRRKRYETDPEYRARILKKSGDYYKRKTKIKSA